MVTSQLSTALNQAQKQLTKTLTDIANIAKSNPQLQGTTSSPSTSDNASQAQASEVISHSTTKNENGITKLLGTWQSTRAKLPTRAPQAGPSATARNSALRNTASSPKQKIAPTTGEPFIEAHEIILAAGVGLCAGYLLGNVRGAVLAYEIYDAVDNPPPFTPLPPAAPEMRDPESDAPEEPNDPKGPDEPREPDEPKDEDPRQSCYKEVERWFSQRLIGSAQNILPAAELTATQAALQEMICKDDFSQASFPMLISDIDQLAANLKDIFSDSDRSFFAKAQSFFESEFTTSFLEENLNGLLGMYSSNLSTQQETYLPLFSEQEQVAQWHLLNLLSDYINHNPTLPEYSSIYVGESIADLNMALQIFHERAFVFASIIPEIQDYSWAPALLQSIAQKNHAGARAFYAVMRLFDSIDSPLRPDPAEHMKQVIQLDWLNNNYEEMDIHSRRIQSTFGLPFLDRLHREGDTLENFVRRAKSELCNLFSEELATAMGISIADQALLSGEDDLLEPVAYQYLEKSAGAWGALESKNELQTEWNTYRQDVIYTLMHKFFLKQIEDLNIEAKFFPNFSDFVEFLAENKMSDIIQNTLAEKKTIAALANDIIAFVNSWLACVITVEESAAPDSSAYHKIYRDALSNALRPAQLTLQGVTDLIDTLPQCKDPYQESEDDDWFPDDEDVVPFPPKLRPISHETPDNAQQDEESSLYYG